MQELAFYAQGPHIWGAFRNERFTRLSHCYLSGPRSQSSELVLFLKGLWDQSPLTRLVVAKGPAPFTVMRVVLAVAQGLALAYPKALIHAPTHFDLLEFTALEQGFASPFTVVLESKVKEFYARCLGTDEVLSLSKENIEGSNEVLISDQPLHPKIKVIHAHWALQLLKMPSPKTSQDLTPFYGHTPSYRMKNQRD